MATDAELNEAISLLEKTNKKIKLLTALADCSEETKQEMHDFRLDIYDFINSCKR